MAKKFYTDKDIEELFHNGIKSLQINDDVVLTDLAFEKARALGLLVDDSPPAAPVRPYLSDVKPLQTKGKPFDQTQGKFDSVSLASSQPQPALKSNPSPAGRGESSLEKRIREKVFAKLGNQVGAGLLDAIIKRTLKATGMK